MTSISQQSKSLINHCLIFLAGFLSFSLQLMETKRILPILGGGVSIWVGALMFYQVFLLGSYLFTYAISRQQKISIFIKTSLVLVPLALVLKGFSLDISSPFWVLMANLVPMGLIYFLLLQVSPLIQFFSKEENPYKYYASSNIGAAVGLLSYPFLIESNIALSSQGLLWTILSVVVLLLSFVALKIQKKENLELPKVYFKIPEYKKILTYSFLGTLFLGAYSATLSEDISGLPLLWVIPLFLYLLAFAMVFGPASFRKLTSPVDKYRDRILESLAMVHVACLFLIGSPWIFVIYSISMFLFFVLLISRLYALKKDEHTSSFYLLLALGGALGGIFNNIWPYVWKYGSDVVLFLLVFYVIYSQYQAQITNNLKKRVRDGIIAVVFLGIYGFDGFENFKNFVYVDRNFFGVVKVLDVVDEKTKDLDSRVFISGRIVHGTQSYADPTMPTAYYQRETALGETLEKLKQSKSSLVAGAIGEGAGVISTYFRSEDFVDYFEINPLVIKIANENFSFVKDSPAKHRFIEGDGRVTLEKEVEGKYDVLIVDAFSGDAIPTHLLTKEAFDLYFNKLKPQGMLLIHITNNFIELAPVIEASLNVRGLKGTYVKRRVNDYETQWMVVGPDTFPNYDGLKKPILWTDEKSQVLDVFSFSKFLFRE